MAKFETTSRRKKTFKVKHMEPKDFRLDYILLPIGFGYNEEYLDAQRGDKMRFFDGRTVVLEAIKKISLKGPIADLLCRMRYGITLKGAIMRWQDNARLEGHSGAIISLDECLWVVYEAREDI